MNEQKFHKECHVVSIVEAMPNSEEKECGNVTYVLIVEEL